MNDIRNIRVEIYKGNATVAIYRGSLKNRREYVCVTKASLDRLNRVTAFGTSLRIAHTFWYNLGTDGMEIAMHLKGKGN